MSAYILSGKHKENPVIQEFLISSNPAFIPGEGKNPPTQRAGEVATTSLIPKTVNLK